MGREREITLVVRRPAELRSRLYPNGRSGGIVVDGPAPGRAGDLFLLRVLCEEPARRHLQVKTQLSWVRHKGSAQLKECFGMDFIPGDSAGRHRLLAFAQGQLSPQDLRHDDRIATQQKVAWSTDGTLHREELLDLSERGAFVRTESPPAVGTRVRLRLRPKGSWLPLKLWGRVQWVRLDGLPRGMGLEFEFQHPREALRLRKLLDRLGAKDGGAVRAPGRPALPGSASDAEGTA